MMNLIVTSKSLIDFFKYQSEESGLFLITDNLVIDNIWFNLLIRWMRNLRAKEVLSSMP